MKKLDETTGIEGVGSTGGLGITIEPYKSVFIPEAKYVGRSSVHPWYGTTELLALGRTPEEAMELSQRKMSGVGEWRLPSVRPNK